MARFVLTDAATEDIREIVRYIRRDSPDAARRVRSELRAAMSRLASIPHMGHLRPDVTDEPLRFWRVHSYLIAYLPDTKPLEVIRVVHGAQDLPRLFRQT